MEVGLEVGGSGDRAHGCGSTSRGVIPVPVLANLHVGGRAPNRRWTLRSRPTHEDDTTVRTGRIALLVLIATTVLGVVAGVVAGIDRRPPRTWDLTGSRGLAEVGWPDRDQVQVEQRDPDVVVFTEIGTLEGTDRLLLLSDGERVFAVEARWTDATEAEAEARTEALHDRAEGLDGPAVLVEHEGPVTVLNITWPRGTP
jgi:hypothetical protein